MQKNRENSNETISLYSAIENNYKNYHLFGEQSSEHYRATINHTTERLHIAWCSIPFSEIPVNIQVILDKKASRTPDIIVFYDRQKTSKAINTIITGYALESI